MCIAFTTPEERRGLFRNYRKLAVKKTRPTIQTARNCDDLLNVLIITLDFDLATAVLSHCRDAVAAFPDYCTDFVSLHQQPNRNDNIIIFSFAAFFNFIVSKVTASIIQFTAESALLLTFHS